MARALVERAGFSGFGTDGGLTIPVYITYVDSENLIVNTKELTLITNTAETALVMNRQLTDLAVNNRPEGMTLVTQDVLLLLHISKGS